MQKAQKISVQVIIFLRNPQGFCPSFLQCFAIFDPFNPLPRALASRGATGVYRPIISRIRLTWQLKMNALDKHALGSFLLTYYVIRNLLNKGAFKAV